MSASARSILVWYWGRRGAGPQITLELTRALIAHSGLNVTASLSTGCSILEDFQHLGIPLHLVETYRNLPSAALATLTLPLKARSLAAFCRAQNVGTVISTMPHLWTPYIQHRLKHCDVQLLSLIHDADPHPGDVVGLHGRMFATPYLWLRQKLTIAELANSDHILTLSDAVRRQLSGRCPPGTPLSILPWGAFGSSDATPLRQYPSKRGFRFLFFGRLMQYKGLYLLLQAFGRLRQTYPECELVIAGDGPQQLSPQPGVTLIQRWIEDDEVKALFDDVDAVVLPHTEASQSGVIPLANHFGLPCIATPVGGLPEQIRHGETGVVAQAVSAQALEAAMAQLAGDAGFYAHCAANIHAARKSDRSWHDAAEMIANLATHVEQRKHIS